ncbi:MAG: lysophospholipid acyltransferase family protein [Pseudomonadota bacterium]
MPSPSLPASRKIVHYVSNLGIMAVIRLAQFLPYDTRIQFAGWLLQSLVGPLAGYQRRALSNLQRVMPRLSKAEHRLIARQCLNNVGRTLIEFYSTAEFLDRFRSNTLEGDGVAALEAAAAEGRPVLLVSGHYGNFESARAALVGRGYPVGGLYRNMANPYFNAHYVKAIESFGGPGFAQGRKGTAGFVRHLRNGGQLVLFIDQHVFGAPALDFMGVPARTSLSAAELSLRYNALLIPFYGIRQPDGLTFQTILEAPIPPSDPVAMTQALNDSLAARVRNDPTQWFWVHRRWRAESD